MAISMLVMGASLSQATKQNTQPAIAATVFIFVYNSFFAIGWLGITWLYPAEVTGVSKNFAKKPHHLRSPLTILPMAI